MKKLTASTAPATAAMKPFVGEKSWFPMEGRFGVFLHFGLYSLLGGEENDRQGMTPQAYADLLMPQFNPADFNADDWVKQIKAAGASHLVLTTRHGEGFCLWDTATTNFKITQTPFGRDLLRELADSCHRNKLRLGLYFAMDDWHFYGGSEPSEPHPGAFVEHIRQQVFELLRNYGDVSLFWFDGSSPLMDQGTFAALVEEMRSLQPGMVINNRGLHHSDPDYELVGDYVTPERFIPDAVSADAPFIEVCDAMGQKGWGYHNDQVFLTSAECIRRLARSASIGGNYLLNVEPTPEGIIRPECVDRLNDIGRWLSVNRRSIFGTCGCSVKPFQIVGQEAFLLGVCTITETDLYIHMTHPLSTDEVELPGLGGEIKEVRILGRDDVVKFEYSDTGLRLKRLPAEGLGENTVIQIRFEASAKLPVKPSAVPPKRRTRVEAEAPTELRSVDAHVLPGPSGISTNQIEPYANGTVSIGRWVDIGSAAQWQVDVEIEGDYCLYARIGAQAVQADSVLEFQCGTGQVRFTVPETGDYHEFRTVKAGIIHLNAGPSDLTVRLVEARRFGPNIHGLALVPVR